MLRMPLRAIIAACTLLVSVANAEAKGEFVSDADFLSRAYAISKLNARLSVIAVKEFTDIHMIAAAMEIFKKNRLRIDLIVAISKGENLQIHERMDQDQRINFKKIGLKKGRDLAQAYITEGLRSYDNALELFTECEKSDARPAVRTFAQKQLRLLKEQRSLIRWIALKKGYTS
jgi:hypothetical protein